VIGHVQRPHGVLGAVRARPTGPTLAELAPGTEVEVGPADGPRRRLTLASRSGEPPTVILSFDGVESREDAVALAGSAIRVSAERLPPLADPDTLYVRDLIGFTVDAGPRRLGAVTDVIPGPANDVLEVVGDGGAVLVPFTADAVVDVDRPGRNLTVRPDLFSPG
jgi:16S rRNA processing protein RimM